MDRVSSVNLEYSGLHDVSGLPGHALPLPQSPGPSQFAGEGGLFHYLHLCLVVKTIIAIIY